MGTKTVSTYCRVCEPQCAVLATVEDGKVTRVDPNRDHVSSLGHFCKKASAMIEITYDPDRLIYPMKRTCGPGEFERISWEQAYSEISGKLAAVRSQHGHESVALYTGNPPSFAYATSMAGRFFTEALGIKWTYCVNAEDGACFAASNILLYGSAGVWALPDLWETDFHLIVGANPMVSHGSTISEPRLAMAIKEVVKRGGRVVVVDPRRTETARGFEHVPVLAGSDPWLALAMIHHIIAEGLYDRAFIDKHTRNFEALKAVVQDCTPERAEPHCGVPAETIRQLAHDFATAKSASMHCRTGASTQRYGTLTTVALHLLCILTGNLDRRGGMSFGWNLMGHAKPTGERLDAFPNRTTGLPGIAGLQPSIGLASDIEQEGEGQVHALVMIGANPVLASPLSGQALPRALQSLELFVALDLYMNETNRNAHYLLPATAMFEREDLPLLALSNMLRPTLYATKAVIKPVGEAKEEWQILNEICRRLGLGGALPGKFLRRLAKLGLRITPRTLIDLKIRMSPVGDRFGLRPGGLSLRKLLRDHPNGVVTQERLPVGILEERLCTPDKKIDLLPEEIDAEIARLKSDSFYQRAEFPLRMTGIRGVLTHNSWMHNAPKTLRAMEQHALINPADASARSIQDDDMITIRSANGEVTVKVRVSDQMSPGNVALHHGWGHNAGWRRANAMGGVNSNIIASDRPEDSERLAGMTVLNGIPVQVRRAVA